MCSVCTVADVARQPITRGRRGKESATRSSTSLQRPGPDPTTGD